MAAAETASSGRDINHAPGTVQNFGFYFLSCFSDRHTGDVSLARGVCTGIKRRDVRVLLGNDVDHFRTNAEGLGYHLRKNGVAALPDLGCPELELHGAVLVHDDPGTCDFQPHRVSSRGVAEAGHA